MICRERGINLIISSIKSWADETNFNLLDLSKAALISRTFKFTLLSNLEWLCTAHAVHVSKIDIEQKFSILLRLNGSEVSITCFEKSDAKSWTCSSYLLFRPWRGFLLISCSYCNLNMKSIKHSSNTGQSICAASVPCFKDTTTVIPRQSQ